MADLIKKIKIKKQDGTFTDYIPIGAEAQNVSTSDGNNVENKINELYNWKVSDPIYYGADPTGIKDSIDAIEECIANNLGGAIYFTPGTYKISRAIKTPWFSEEQININFNGSKIYTDEALDYVIGIGFYNYSSNQDPIKGDYSIIHDHAIISNVVIEAPNAQIGILTKTGYWYPRLDNITIHNTIIGIQAGDSTGGSTDLALYNSFIQCKDYKNKNTIGIRVTGNDNKIENCRIYNASTGIELNGSGNFLHNVHVYLYGHHRFHETSTTAFATAFERTIGIADAGTDNFFSQVYIDSYKTHYKRISSDIRYKISFNQCFFYNNTSNINCIVFDLNSNIYPDKISITDCNIDLGTPQTVCGHKGIYFHSTPDAASLVNRIFLRNNILADLQFTQDLLMLDSDKPYTNPYNGAYYFQANQYYIVGYIPLPVYFYANVSIANTGNDNQSARIGRHSDGSLTITNTGITGDDWGIGAKNIQNANGEDLVEISIMSKTTKPAIYGLSYDIKKAGIGLGLIPVCTQKIQLNPANYTTTPDITTTCGA